MANTKTTTPTKWLPRAGLALGASAMAVFAVINLFATMTPVATKNKLLDAHFEKAQALAGDLRRALFMELRDDQAANLAYKPSDPYGWSRLSYLRLSTGNDAQAAFAALAMADFVSPSEAPELPERAVMWYRYSAYENEDQKAYQDSIWQKAYTLEPEMTWKAAVQNNLVSQAGESLKKSDPALYASWQGRVSSAH